ncbi:MAG: hypothetical protein ABI315_03680 [Bacteroidia bacterium]
MKKQFQYLICFGILNFILFTGVFKLLQNEKVYINTLGLISQNYERIGDWNNFEIKKTSKPFVQITTENFETWDAAIYKCISESMYSRESHCYENIRAAFFPLFPLLWKITHSSCLGISILNYLIFIISIAILVLVLLNTTLLNKIIAFTILISLPSSINYYIPYSESLFLFTMTIATLGIFKKKYWMFFIGCFLLAMVRPATIFVLFAILFAELIIFMRNKEWRSFIKEVTFKSLPFILGYCFTIFIQYLYSGSWTALFDARKYWKPTVSFTHFSDWSVEGFGLSIFVIFFLCIPAIVFILSLLFSNRKPVIKNYLENLSNYKSEYLLIVSILYLIGMFIFSLSTQGLDFHSFPRYILASPLFYIAILILLNNLGNKSCRLFNIIYFILTVSIILFLSNVEYGGSKIQFSFFGLYLFILTGAYLIIKKVISHPLQIFFAIILILLNTIWNAYLLNAFFSNAWIFT